jgi:hypothetical protein
MTKYGVYIIEFLRADDYTDGENLHEILKLSLIPTKYNWVDTKEDFKKAIKEFNASKFRYLHISCHADETGFEINGEKISNSEFQSMTKKVLTNKRVFLSACKGANRDIASKIIISNKAYSLIGIPIDIYFDKSAIFWPTFYHLINEVDKKAMKRDLIIDIAKKCVNLLNVPINYYSRINNSSTHIRRLKFRQGHTDNLKIKVAK